MLWPIKGQTPWLGMGGPADLGTACSGHTVSSDTEALWGPPQRNGCGDPGVDVCKAQSSTEWVAGQREGALWFSLSLFLFSPSLLHSHNLCPDISIFSSHSL